MSKLKFQPVKGTRDFYPEDMAFRNWLFGKMREVSKKFGYQEYEGPILEPLELYAAKSGEELVKKQTFVLTDRGGRKLALRPEMTPTLARMVAQREAELPKPIRWFSIGPRFRYEQPQKGRLREFYQWDIDILGSEAPEADAEIIAVACEFLKSIGLISKEVKIKVNDRSLMEQKLSLIEVPKGKIQEVFKAVDKKEKMAEEEWDKWLKEIGLTSLQVKDLKGILKDRDFSRESEKLTRIFSTLSDLGVSDFVEFDPNVVRGLDYYTGIVFEARDVKSKFRAILGGGRYDNLVEVVGGPKIAGTGFAAGDVVIEEVLKEYKKTPKISFCPTRVLVTVFTEGFFRKSLEVATLLRRSNIETELYPDPASQLDKQLKYASQKEIPYVVILGPEEAESGKVTLKNMATGKQKTISINEVGRVIL
ncbi:histidine--tRNA ligase [Candidatus Shapirobacteria bacterium CG10_big_fil_rev_8_21_14_0_10_40_9]|uniref:Histidine--tRNA ligase n=1 Tax=Candidatus Shapirobacteria bacterium CG10_big_fil_rev_8_21_14_0_10_40_9 TaxID=1974888 RepID=A0A2M8L3K7_9BACT|nr:MAG: histidine--tRNA ligase [Candidatus Shapirobacteria bacterium CG10_big_fil_rev_8_21_14_0_10_40_9]